MGRYIYAERIKLLMKQDRILQGNCEYELWKQEVDRQVNALPYIELDDYVPREFHDKTCEAMAKAHQAEILELTADRPQGYYIKGENGEWYCSICKRIDDKYSVARFCWHCGARMKGAGDESVDRQSALQDAKTQVLQTEQMVLS